MTVDGAKGFENRRLGGKQRSGAVADFFDDEGERAAAAQVNQTGNEIRLLDSFFDGVTQRVFEACQLRGIGRAKVDGGAGALRNGVDAGAALDGSVIHGGARIFGQRRLRELGESLGESGDGIWRACIGKAVSARAV